MAERKISLEYLKEAVMEPVNFWGMAGFVGIIALGWLYAYREGVLEWK